MRNILACGLAAIFLATAGFAADDKKDEKIDTKKLIGKWEPADKKEQFSMVVEFAAKDKLTLAVTVMDKTEKIEGTYKLNGNKVDLVLAFGGKEQKETLTITKLSDTELATEDSKGKKETFKRLKDK